MRRYALARRARLQLNAIYDYSSERWSEAQAELYSRTLFQTFEHIADGTIRSRSFPAEYGVEGSFCSCKRHVIYWRLQRSGRIEIVAVVDQRMLQSRQVRIAYGLAS